MAVPVLREDRKEADHRTLSIHPAVDIAPGEGNRGSPGGELPSGKFFCRLPCLPGYADQGKALGGDLVRKVPERYGPFREGRCHEFPEAAKEPLDLARIMDKAEGKTPRGEGADHGDDLPAGDAGAQGKAGICGTLSPCRQRTACVRRWCRLLQVEGQRPLLRHLGAFLWRNARACSRSAFFALLPSRPPVHDPLQERRGEVAPRSEAKGKAAPEAGVDIEDAGRSPICPHDDVHIQEDPWMKQGGELLPKIQ